MSDMKRTSIHFLNKGKLNQRFKVRPVSKWNSSNESLFSASCSNHMQSESDTFSSDSDFEEHAYSCNSLKRDKKRTTTKSEERSIGSKYFDKVSRMDETSSLQTKPRCTSKNAIMARKNRLKKKKYLASLELKNEELVAENLRLKNLLSDRMDEVVSLKRETLNLQSTIRNSTTIGSLLKCIHENTNLQISSSLIGRIGDSEIGNFSTFSQSFGLEFPHEGKGNHNLIMDPSLALHNNHDTFKYDFLNPSSDTLKHSDNISNVFDMSLLSRPANNLLISDDPLRCETPTKGIDGSLGNKDDLFEDLGICFHLANNKVTLEFCDICNDKAKSHLP